MQTLVDQHGGFDNKSLADQKSLQITQHRCDVVKRFDCWQLNDNKLNNKLQTVVQMKLVNERFEQKITDNNTNEVIFTSCGITVTGVDTF